MCDARSTNEEKKHSIENAIDGTNRWWMSPTLQNGKNYEWITITLDLKQVRDKILIIRINFNEFLQFIVYIEV